MPATHLGVKPGAWHTNSIDRENPATWWSTRVEAWLLLHAGPARAQPISDQSTSGRTRLPTRRPPEGSPNGPCERRVAGGTTDGHMRCLGPQPGRHLLAPRDT